MASIVTSRTRTKARRRPQWPFCLNEESIFSTGLVHWWPLSKLAKDGVARDFGWNPTDIPPVTVPTWAGDSKMGYVPNFDETNPDYYQTSGGGPAIYLGDKLTVSAWVWPSSSQISDYAVIACRDVYVYPWRINTAGDHSYMTFVARNSSSTSVSSSSSANSLNKDTWNLLTGVYDGANVRCYLNGEAVGSPGSLTGDLINTGVRNYSIGYGTSSLWPTTGKITDVCVWLRALLPMEVRALYSPPTRWDLYCPLGRKSIHIVGVSGGDASKDVDDVGGGTDAIGAITNSLTIGDVGGGSDDNGTILASIPVEEVGGGTDAIASLTCSLTIDDVGGGTDAITQVIKQVLKTIEEVGSGTDAISSLTCSLSIGDVGGGVDIVAQLLASLTIEDVGGGVDDVSAGITITAEDVGLGTDAITQIIKSSIVLIEETGTGVDAISSIVATIPVSDVGQGTDIVSQILNSLTIGDTGGGVDGLSIATTITDTFVEVRVKLHNYVEKKAKLHNFVEKKIRL